MSENRERKSSLGRKPLLDSDQEQQLSSRIIRLSNVGYPLTPRVLRTCVKRYCDANNIGVNTQSQMIGRDWLRGFMKRHRNIRRRKAQNLNPARAQKVNKFVVSDYFSKLKKIMDENDFLIDLKKYIILMKMVVNLSCTRLLRFWQSVVLKEFI